MDDRGTGQANAGRGDVAALIVEVRQTTLEHCSRIQKNSLSCVCNLAYSHVRVLLLVVVVVVVVVIVVYPGASGTAYLQVFLCKYQSHMRTVVTTT